MGKGESSGDTAVNRPKCFKSHENTRRVAVKSLKSRKSQSDLASKIRDREFFYDRQNVTKKAQ